VRKYSELLIKKITENTRSLSVNGIDVEVKEIPDGVVPDTIDPRLLQEVEIMYQRSESSRNKEQAPPSIEEIRTMMGGFNHNLNTVEIYTRYVEVSTSYGQVPIWMYYPRKMKGKRPALLYVHGGAFFGGSIFAVENQCRLIAERANCVVCNIDYSLAPESAYPIPCTQVYDCLSYLHVNAEAYNIDSSEIYMAGDSAGGNITAVSAQMDRDKNTNYLKGQILIYAKLTFTNNLLEGYTRDLSVFKLSEEQKKYLPMITEIGSDESNAGDEQVYVQGKYDITNPYISPAFGEKADLPKTLFLQAEYDGLRLEGEFYAKQLLEAGVSIKMVRYRGVTHGFFDKLGILPQTEDVVDEIVEFMIKE
jgi:acetyl esterase/lipase